ncbi:hypothetical protein NA57DRAFT_53437 [Rhizodiscina lignyota]|uniref:Zn(2)-C6 fungal-type domain-containing protein n=1 Tax=Rhizodiscina lignyota TaxID=1504668 RepID=A0A9P4MBJ9_9PEZI|nr:hypothetical protein NA57DRAFT_53437 [Rhizodiscina lignyota]
MDPGDQDAKHPHLEQTPPSRQFESHPHRPYPHQQVGSVHAVSHQGHLTLPLPLSQARPSGPQPPLYGSSRQPAGPPRAFPHTNNSNSPPAGTTHSDPRYSSAGPPTHGVATSYPQRSYSVDSGVQRSAPLPVHPGGEGRQPVSAGGLQSSVDSGGPMDHHNPHGQPYGEHPPPNGMVHGTPHGMPILPHGEQYQQHPHHQQPGPPHQVAHGYGHPQPQFAGPQYSQAPYTHHQAQQSVPRKKANRAQQACQQCRNRKQKCDEQRPCAFCEKEGLPCEYKETQPPKQDRTQLDILERVTNIEQMMKEMQAGQGGTKRKHSLIRDTGEDESPRHAKSPTTSSQKAEEFEYGESEDTNVPPGSAVSENIPSMEANFAQPTNHVPTGYSSTFAEGQHQEPANTSEGLGGMPSDHTTSVDHLRTWPYIKNFYRESHHQNEPTVTKHEYMQGWLRVNGIGQTGDEKGKEEKPQINEPIAPSPASDDSNVVENDEICGGPLTDGYLRLDERTVRTLEDSYFRNFHILHPFLDRSRFKKMLESFIVHYAAPGPPYSSPHHMDSTDTSGGSTSSRMSRFGGEGYGSPYTNSFAEDFGHFPRHRPIARTLNNAIVLLVLALGRIALYKSQKLPGPASAGTSVAYSHTPPRSAASPSGSIRPSPTVSRATMSMTPSPHMSGAPSDSMSRAPSNDGLPMPVKKEARNIDIIPGLAYFAEAQDTIYLFASVPNRGDELLQVWAFILAGLYMGQLARVMESFFWVDKACKAWLRLKEKFNKADLNDYRSKDKNIDLVKLAFWTCLQLESDIRAELNFDDPKIGRFEDEIGLPNNVFEDVTSADTTDAHDVYIFYSLQIQLRKILNQTHSLVYRKKKEKPEYTNEQVFSPGSSGSILENLEDLRAFINKSGKPQSLRGWSDDNPTSPDINVSRIRGKYYGARYIILRPFLFHAIKNMKPRTINAQDVETEDQHIPRELLGSKRDNTERLNPDDQDIHIIRAAKMCINAAISSTIAFDGLLPNRFLVTNIHGTALAQFGNMLVLSAAYLSWLGPSHGNHLVPGKRLIELLKRTISLMTNLASLSRIMAVNVEILQAALRKVLETHDKYEVPGMSSDKPGLPSAHSSFGPST